MSALPLVEAMESLPGLVKIHVLNPPTLPALQEELDRGREEMKPYHVVHFDGHGVFNREVGLGGLCFEKPEDVGKLEKRGHVTVFTSELGPLLRDHRIPLVFLEACQTALAEKASESVASELLKVGVASVVAMSHNLLVETAYRFVNTFYQALAGGQRVGDAMLAGQRQLKDDTFRGQVFGIGEFRLEDWFVPILFQEKDDPQLFKITPTKQTQEDFKAALVTRLGDLPPEPQTGFIGRSRELLVLQRLLREERYAVVRGQGGEGKTALAAEFARWMVRSQQIHRAAFVSVETYGNQHAIVDAIGKQLVQKEFSAAGDLEEAIQLVERVLREQPVLLVLDSIESVLLPPFIMQELPEALLEEAREELSAILGLCQRLMKAGDTRVLFTSREVLPAPFDGKRNRRELHGLDREDAVQLVGRVLNVAGASSDAARDDIERLVDAVNCHARTLALLAPSLQQLGVEATRESLVELMMEMEKRFPGSREQSVFASVELSLRRMSQENRDRARVLGVFHGGLQLGLLRLMMQWEEDDVASLARELIETGLATPNVYNHLTLNSALSPYVRRWMDTTERESLTARWIDAMLRYTEFLEQQRSENVQSAAMLTVLELPNLFALLDLVQRAGDPEVTIRLATSLFSLLQVAGKPRLVERIAQVRDAAVAALRNTWNHAGFEASRTRIEQQLTSGELREAVHSAQQLLGRARDAGEQAYRDADYDLAMACNLLGQAMEAVGASEQALPLLDESYQRFETFAKRHPGRGAEGMAAACFITKATSLRRLGRLDEAAAVCEEAIWRAEQINDHRGIVVAKGQLGTVRMLQHRYHESLAAYAEAREQFTQFDEPGSVAVIWHQIGNVFQAANEHEAAEDAYHRSLSISTRLGDVAGQAGTLAQLGSLYNLLGNLEETTVFYSEALGKYLRIGDVKKEGFVRNNLAKTLCTYHRFDDARHEILRAIECGAQFGNAAEPWKTWSILADIETKAGSPSAALEAKRKAIATYLNYRQSGGENQFPDGRLSLAVTEHLLAGDSAAAVSLLQQPVDDTVEWLRPLYSPLEAIVNGSRDRALADDPDLNFSMATEILFAIETLERAQPAPSGS